MKYLYTNFNGPTKTTTVKDGPRINMDKFKEGSIIEEDGIIIQQKILETKEGNIGYQEIIFDGYTLNSVIDIYSK